MIQLAHRMLFGDHSKFLVFVFGLTFASLLMLQQSGVFCAMMTWTFASLGNMRAAFWLCNPILSQVNDHKSLQHTNGYRVRSVERREDRSFTQIQMLGIAATTMAEAPRPMIARSPLSLCGSHRGDGGWSHPSSRGDHGRHPSPLSLP